MVQRCLRAFQTFRNLQRLREGLGMGETGWGKKNPVDVVDVPFEGSQECNGLSADDFLGGTVSTTPPTSIWAWCTDSYVTDRSRLVLCTCLHLLHLILPVDLACQSNSSQGSS